MTTRTEIAICVAERMTAVPMPLDRLAPATGDEQGQHGLRVSGRQGMRRPECNAEGQEAGQCRPVPGLGESAEHEGELGRDLALNRDEPSPKAEKNPQAL